MVDQTDTERQSWARGWVVHISLPIWLINQTARVPALTIATDGMLFSFLFGRERGEKLFKGPGEREREGARAVCSTRWSCVPADPSGVKK